MKSIRICIILFFITFCGNAFAGELMDFELTDGTTIHGRLVSYANGVYTIKTKSLGIVKVGEEKVKTTRRAGGAVSGPLAAQSAGGGIGPDVQGMVTKMQGDEEIMYLINSLKDDPEMQAILNDPETMKAISAGDLSALMANPKIMELLNNQKVREIQKKMGQ
jgi:hypothetical protein